MTAQAAYPLRLEAELEPGLSRWLWLVKWFLAIPHLIVLGFLWIAYGLLTLVAFFAIIFSGRYPPAIFDFNVGVLRWWWRVADYAFGVLGTDQYPPFTLAEVPGYPAHLEVAYPERLSRGLVLVKWFLAIPHLLIVGILVGGASWIAWNMGGEGWAVGANLIGLLVIIAAVTLAVTGSYPRPMFDLILGLNRWVLRVAAYVGLMTDQYPPFRLDMGGTDRGGPVTIPRPPEEGPAAPPMERSGWTGGRITSLVIGVIVGMIALGLLSGGGVLAWAVTQRDSQGFYPIDTQRYAADGYALTASADVTRFGGTRWLAMRGPGWFLGPGTSGTVRLRVTPTEGDRPTFVGIGPTEEVGEYLDGVAMADITDLDRPAYRTTDGTAPAGPPVDQGFWVASDAGSGTRVVTWAVQEGDWTVVLMNVDASRGVDLRADATLRVPGIPWIALGLAIGGALLLLVAVLMIAIPVRRASVAPAIERKEGER